MPDLSLTRLVALAVRFCGHDSYFILSLSLGLFTCGYAGIVIVSFRCNQTLFSVYTRPMSNRNHVITRNEGHRFQIWGQK